MKTRFRGRLAMDARESTPDWAPYVPPDPPEGAPNILYIVWDDVGFGALDCYGGLIETPAMTRLANAGLRYTQYHGTGLGSATRSCLLTGRNASSNAMACIPEHPTGFPGSNGHIPYENGLISEVLVEQGYSTWAVGKWHLTPDTDRHAAGSRRQWPLGRGFDRFYGFLGAETSQWYPLLEQDNQCMPPPGRPDDGYHLSVDLANHALQYIRDASSAAPDKPWLLYFAPACAHAPHHAPKEWIERYRGKFDQGYEHYREVVLARQIEMGLVPEGTGLPPRDPYAHIKGPQGQKWPTNESVRPWSQLSPDERLLFCRMAEVYAGYVAHCDHQIGRILDVLEETGQLTNTIVIAVSASGASASGGPTGNLSLPVALDDLGSPTSYHNYCTGWAQAFSTPFKLFESYASYEGGTADPMIVSWPAHIAARGELRHQYCHASDIVPTLYHCLGIEPPEVVHGYRQSELEGDSFMHTFEDAATPTKKRVQLYGLLGTRGIWFEGWHASTIHPAMGAWGGYDQDRWELFYLDEDRNQLTDLASEHPSMVEKLKNMWAMLAGKYQALPLDDRTCDELVAQPRPHVIEPRAEYIYYPNTEPVPQDVGVPTIERSFSIAADVDIVDGHPEGVLFSQGSPTGGHTLYVHDGRVHYVYNWLGTVQQKLSSRAPLLSGKHTIRVSFEVQAHDATWSPVGPARLFIDDKEVAEHEIKTQPARFGIDGVITVGRETGKPPTDDYHPPAVFHGGIVEKVRVAVKERH
jgi:arylsulfatase